MSLLTDNSENNDSLLTRMAAADSLMVSILQKYSGEYLLGIPEYQAVLTRVETYRRATTIGVNATRAGYDFIQAVLDLDSVTLSEGYN